MSDPPEPQPDNTSEPSGLSVSGGRDVNVGGDVAGRDVVKTTTTITGFSEQAVQRLLLMVGALVFVTAACFFSGGLAVGFFAFDALNKQVGSSPEAAARFQASLARLNALQPGQRFELTFSEDEISSYVRFIAGPQLGFAPDTGRARLVTEAASGETLVVIAGQLQAAGNLPVIATLDLQNTPGEPFRIRSAAARVLNTGTPFGWVAVPTPIVQPVQDRLNSLLGDVALTSAVSDNDPVNPTWQINGVVR